MAEFRVLGVLDARVGGRPVDVGHLRQWCVLAALLVDANRAVHPDQLVDRVWGERPPQRARETVYGYVSRLRRAFAGTGDVGIRRQPGGYVLDVDPDAVDLHRFQRLTGAARTADGDAALALLQQALDLWHGEAFATLDTPWLCTVRAGLDRARLAAELDRNDLALARGRHAEVLGDLTAAAAAHPLDERLAGQLMLALYRSGRQGDALDRYRRMRLRLAEELGTDPGPALQAVHRSILTAEAAVRTAAPVPAAPRGFTGRADELSRVTEAVDAAGVCAIVGPGGIGKTWLALRWADGNRRRYPDGQLHVDLRGFDPAGPPVPPAVAIRGFLDALGVAPQAIPAGQEAQAARYRSLVAERRLLIVLDNARDSGQVVPLLPGTPGCTVLVTSRRQLTSLVSAHGARPVTLDLLGDADARDVLTSHLGTVRMAAEPDAVAALVRRCAGLPLALGIVAARAAVHPRLPLGALAAELDGTATRLDALDAGELAVNLRAVLSCSVESLPEPAARLFGLLGLAPGPDLSVAAAASLAGVRVGAARILLRQLGAAHLVQEYQPGRYRMHDLVRLYAAEQAPADEAARHRILDHYLHTAYAADRMLSPHRDPVVLSPPRPGVTVDDIRDHGAALAWFTAEHAGLVTAVEQAADGGFDTHAWQLAWTLATFLDHRAHWDDRASTHAAALDAARRLADRPAQAYARRGLALAQTWLGRYEEARVHLRHALDLFGELGDVAGQAHIHRSLARSYAREGRPERALPHDERALKLYRAAGHRDGQANALNSVGWHHAHLGEHRLALEYCHQALALYEEIGNRHGAAATWDSLGYAHRHLGEYVTAVACCRRAVTLFHELGNRYLEAVTLRNLGDTHQAAGRIDQARVAWRQADRIFDELRTRDRLAAAA